MGFNWRFKTRLDCLASRWSRLQVQGFRLNLETASQCYKTPLLARKGRCTSCPKLFEYGGKLSSLLACSWWLEFCNERLLRWKHYCNFGRSDKCRGPKVYGPIFVPGAHDHDKTKYSGKFEVKFFIIYFYFSQWVTSFFVQTTLTTGCKIWKDQCFTDFSQMLSILLHCPVNLRQNCMRI